MCLMFRGVLPGGPQYEGIHSTLSELLHTELEEAWEVEEEREAEYHQVGNMSAIGGHVPAGQGSILQVSLLTKLLVCEDFEVLVSLW